MLAVFDLYLVATRLVESGPPGEELALAILPWMPNLFSLRFTFRQRAKTLERPMACCTVLPSETSTFNRMY